MKNQNILLGVFGVMLIIVVGVFLFSSRSSDDVQDKKDVKLRVATTIFPIAEFARAVGGDKVSVETLIPTGAEPHAYEPSPKDIVLALEADVFLYNGAFMEPWGDDVADQAEGEGVRVRKMSEYVEVYNTEEGHEHEHDEEGHDEEGHEHEHGGVDPHFWLSLTSAKKEIEVIQDVLIAVDKKNSTYYQKNAKDFITKLDELDKKYQSGLSSCAKDTVIVTHDAFGYLSREYGFETLSFQGLSPQHISSAKDIVDIADTIKADGIQYILAEPYLSESFVDTLVEEGGLEKLTLNPMGRVNEKDRQSGATYLSIFEENLSALKTALECK